MRTADIPSASPTRCSSSHGVRAGTLALLAASDAVFLWMFLATDPLTQLAAGSPDWPADLAPGFAAHWRHGMAGNAWVYMPGFHATAAALWLHARHTPARLAPVERILAGLLGLAAALGAAPAGAALVVQTFADTTTLRVAGRIPAPAAAAIFSGAYTLATWSAFVLACRQALVRRTLRPFVVPAILAVGLVLLRPWTVDDFTSYWAAGVLHGHASACLSLALVFVLAGLLAAAERGSSEPEPHERALQGREPAYRQHADQIGRDGERIEPG